jgi:uncharacterized protein (DUF2249 family)/quercetin dioxygenase-like cupin family protein
MGSPVTTELLDVRPLRKPDKHPTIFGVYDDLGRGESFVLVNNHDPVHLRDEFEVEHAGGFGWEYLERGPQEWRIQITKLASSPLPRVLCNTFAAAKTAAETDPAHAGAAWKLQMRRRDLDSNIIRLPAEGIIEMHTGPDLDVLIHVLAGAGELTTELEALALEAGDLLWLPRHSRRQFTAGPDGLSYLTVHQRRQALTLTATQQL